MNKLCIHIVGMLTLLAMSSNLVGADREPVKAVVVAITLSQDRPADDEPKILAEPTIAVTVGRPFSFQNGGELKTKNGEDVIEFGTEFSGTVNECEGGLLLVAIKLAVSRPVTDAHNPDIDLVRTETLDLRTTMAAGQKKQIKCGQAQTLEIHLKPISTAVAELRHENSLRLLLEWPIHRSSASVGWTFDRAVERIEAQDKK